MEQFSQVQKDSPRFFDLQVFCKEGGSVSTSCLLLASISPWLRSLLEETGQEVEIILPDITTNQFTAFLDVNQDQQTFQNRVETQFNFDDIFLLLNIETSKMYSGFKSQLSLIDDVFNPNVDEEEGEVKKNCKMG